MQGTLSFGKDAIGQMARMLEGMIRSCNSLIERPHHSLTLYLLAGPHAVLSLSLYIVPVVLLVVIPSLAVCATLVTHITLLPGVPAALPVC